MFDVVLEPVRNRTVSVHYMGDLEESGSTTKYSYVTMRPDDCMTIIYTSGSSGFPKGAIIPEKAYRATFPGVFSSSSRELIRFCYRPLAWAASRDSIIGSFLSGGRVGISTGDVSRLFEELALVRPTQFSAPPGIWNKVYAEFQVALSKVDHSYSSEAAIVAKRRLLRKFSKLIPIRCKILTTGSAKMSPIVMAFIRECFTHCEVNDSYGITECGGVTYNDMLDSGVNFRLESVPEMGYTLDDKPYPRGEILAKTTQMFSGYINNPEETRAALTKDGYFRTGDIVELRSDVAGHTRFLVIDRKKSFFKLSQGLFVSPEYLQGIYIQSPFVEQIYIHGDLLADCVSAVIVPNREYTQIFVNERQWKNFDMNNPDPQLHRAILDDLRSIAKKESLAKHEIPSHLVIDVEPFTAENGLLTSSLKPCRPKLAAHYADRLKPTRSIQTRLETILHNVNGSVVPQKDDDHIFLSGGGDSLAAVRLSRMIENELGISVPVSTLFEPNMNLERLTTLITDPSTIGQPSPSIVPQLLIDSRLNIDTRIGPCKATSRSPSTVFITGTTGFVGAFLLAELLETSPPHCKFICLGRTRSLTDPWKFIRQTMLFYQLWNNAYHTRIVPLYGDLSKPHFGLDKETYALLVEETDLIFHCGATVNFVLPYSQLYGSNVCGTREIIRLATHHPSTSIPVQYISTISVLPPGFNKEIPIDQIPPDGLTSGYGQSKWVAEKLISQASRAGLPVTIYRLGSIGASSGTGACNRHDIHTLLLAAMISTTCYPSTARDTYLSGLPVDFTARSLVHLSKTPPDASGRIYHVVNADRGASFVDILEGVRRCGVRLRGVSHTRWLAQLEGLTDRTGPFEAVEASLLDSALNESSTISGKRFFNAISSLDLPPLDSDYNFKWMHFILNHIVR